MLVEFCGKGPRIGDDCYIHPSAVIIGDVTIGDRCIILPNVVIRGDINSIRIGNDVNIQDNTVMHTASSSSIQIGDRVSIGHRAIIHGAEISSDVVIGMGAIVLDRVKIGSCSLIGAGAVVTLSLIHI